MRVSTSATWRASELIMFQLGVGYRHDAGHGISNDQPCNPDQNGDITKSGPCHTGTSTTITSSGTPNPNFRAVVNEVGRRFFVDDSNTFDLFAMGVVMF